MVGAHLRAKAAAPAGMSAPSALVVADASTQMLLVNRKAVVQNSDSRKCLDLSPGTGTVAHRGVPINNAEKWRLAMPRT